MKIGILTLTLHANYGGILQAYALQTVLERMGHEVEVIQISTGLRWKHLLFVALKRLVKNIVKGTKYVLMPELKTHKQRPIEGKYTHQFIDKRLHVRYISKYTDLKPTDYEAYVVGSDQVWRPQYAPDIYAMFLNFAKEWSVKRLSYAASFGTGEWLFTQKQTYRCAKLVKYFDAISVREIDGIGLCQHYLGVEACHVLDPTLLLEATDYLSLLPTDLNPQKNTLVTYVLDPTPLADSLIEQVAKDRKLTVKRANSRYEERTAPIEERIQPPVEQWLYDLSHAEFVITDSFHACAFCIIFGKPFIVIKNQKRGNSRFDTLFRLFGLKKNNIVHIEDYDASCSYFTNTDIKRKELQQIAIEFITKSLS